MHSTDLLNAQSIAVQPRSEQSPGVARLLKMPVTRFFIRQRLENIGTPNTTLVSRAIDKLDDLSQKWTRATQRPFLVEDFLNNYAQSQEALSRRSGFGPGIINLIVEALKQEGVVVKK